MKRLEYYLARTIIRSTVIVLLVFLSVQLLVSLLHELRDLGHGDYHLWHIIEVVVLQLPSKLYQLFPMAGLIGSLVGLGLLASHSELIAMRAAGFTKVRIVIALIKIALIMIVAVTLVGEFVAPITGQRAQNAKATALSGGQAIKTLYGLWLRDGNTFIHIDKVLPNRSLEGVTLYEFDDQQHLLVTRVAHRASYQQQHWLLKNVQQTKILKDKTVAEHVDVLPWNISLKPNILGWSRIKSRDMSLLKLHRYIRYRERNDLLANNFSLVFWQRILQPLATLVMILIAIPFVFGPLRSAAMGLRLFEGICLGFSFFIANQFVGPMSLVYQVPPAFAASIPILLFALLGAVLFWRKVH